MIDLELKATGIAFAVGKTLQAIAEKYNLPKDELYKMGVKCFAEALEEMKKIVKDHE